MTNREKAELTYKALQERKRRRANEITAYECDKIQHSLSCRNRSRYGKKTGRCI